MGEANLVTATRFLELLAGVNEAFIETAIALRAHPEVSELTHTSNLRGYPSGTTFEFGVDVETRWEASFSWWLEILTKEGKLMLLERRITRNTDAGWEEVRTYPDRAFETLEQALQLIPRLVAEFLETTRSFDFEVESKRGEDSR